MLVRRIARPHTSQREGDAVFSKLAIATADTQRPLLPALEPRPEREYSLNQR